MSFVFTPFQMLSGNVRVHQVVLNEGSVFVPLDPTLFKKNEKKQRKENQQKTQHKKQNSMHP
jgi:hypothetical protein